MNDTAKPLADSSERIGGPIPAALVSLTLLLALPAWAGVPTITVTTVQDVQDGDVSSIASLLASPGPDGQISYREAVAAAENSGGGAEIVFSVSGTTFFVVEPPVLAGGGIAIRGGGAITFEGSQLANGESGILITSANNVIDGLTIVNFPDSGVKINGPLATDNIIRGCRIGTDGRRLFPLQPYGISINGGATRNEIGGVNEGDGKKSEDQSHGCPSRRRGAVVSGFDHPASI